MKRMLNAAALLTILALAITAHADEFSYNPPGQLEGGNVSGRADDRVYVPGMRHPIEEAPSYANSQIYGHGGFQGPGGGQCDPNNYAFPWSDNFCESRSWNMPLCPSGTGHQGQDIRPATCTDKAHWAVAAESGTITSIGTYSVNLMSDTGTKHRYLHMDPGTLAVTRGQRVNKGDRLGLVSNAFGGTPTTIHLHYDLNQNVEGVGNAYVPTYMSLIRSYEELIGMEAEPCPAIAPDGATLDNNTRCFSLQGNPRFWRYVEDAGIEGDLYWTNAWTNDSPGNWARWRLNFTEAGRYRVSINNVPEYAQSQQAIYTVRHAGTEDTVRVDQSQPGPDGWVTVGEFEFAVGEDQSVSVFDNTGESSDLERHIMVDGLRFERLDGQPPMPDAGMPDADVSDPPMEDVIEPDVPEEEEDATPTADVPEPEEDAAPPPPIDDPPVDNNNGNGGDQEEDPNDAIGTSSQVKQASCAQASSPRAPMGGTALWLGLMALVWGLRRRRA